MRAIGCWQILSGQHKHLHALRGWYGSKTSVLTFEMLRNQRRILYIYLCVCVGTSWRLQTLQTNSFIGKTTQAVTTFLAVMSVEKAPLNTSPDFVVFSTNGINYPVPMVSLQVLLHELSTTRQRTGGKRNQAKRSYDGTPDLNSVSRFRLMQSLRITQCVNQLNANYLQSTRFFSILFHMFFHFCHLF